MSLVTMRSKGQGDLRGFHYLLAGNFKYSMVYGVLSGLQFLASRLDVMNLQNGYFSVVL